MKAAWIAVVACGCKLAAGAGWSTGSSSAGPTNGSAPPAPEGTSESTRTFVSTTETAAKLNGLPGRPCDEQHGGGEDGPCWDPPGRDRSVPMAHLQPGMRVMEALDWRFDSPRAVYWFDAPREAKLGSDGEILLPDFGGGVTAYEPYDDEGFTRPTLPAMVGKPIDEVLKAFDALDMPFAVAVKYTEHCEGAQDVVCKITSSVVTGKTSRFQLAVALRIRHRGLPTEQRKRPAEEKLVNRAPEEVRAELAAIGFSNVVVVEKDLPCKRGIVCSVPGHDGWHGTNASIELWVRHAK
ncbi:MAG: hypothetical protein AB7T06_18985 [Kofleriaceae bacterium]